MNAPNEKDLFADVLARPAAERAAFLAQACQGDAALQARIESLLRAYDEADDYLEKPPTAALQAPADQDEAPGDRIGRYKLLQKIGEGGCGTVYMAEQEEPVRRRVALKVIKLGMDTKEVIARFDAERQALALMDHPAIARVFDAGATAPGRPYFVMELVRGVKITDYCDEHNLSTAERLALFIQVCHAVQHAHQKGIIHRDLKPSNVLVAQIDGAAVPKVIDFGIAKATVARLTDQTLFTAFEQFIGTPVYMSPEQAELTSNDIDTRADIYSLGVLLYELLTGRPPFDPRTLAQAGLGEVRRILREVEPPRPSTRLGTLSDADRATAATQRHTDAPRLVSLVRGDLDWIVMKALEKNRARRYETANALANDVQRHLQQEPIMARPPSKLYRAQKLVARNKIAFAAAAAVLLALVAGLGVSLWGLHEAEAARRVTDRARGEAEKLMTFLLEDFYDEFAPTGQLATVARLAKQAADYYAGLPPELRSAATERNRAFALTRYGAALTSQGYSVQSRPVLTEAITILRQLRNEGDRSEPVLLNLMFAKRRLIGSALPALTFLKQAVADVGPLATVPTATRRLRLEYGELLLQLGYIQDGFFDEKEDAIATLVEARQVFAELGAREFTDLRVSDAYVEATIVAAGARGQRAAEKEKLAKEALALTEAVLARSPADLRALFNRALLAGRPFWPENVGVSRLLALQQEEARWAELVRYDPSMSKGWRALGEVRLDIVALMIQQGQVRAGLARFESAVPNRQIFACPDLASLEVMWWRWAAILAAYRGDRAEAERCLAGQRRALELRVSYLSSNPNAREGPEANVDGSERQVREILGDFAAEFEGAQQALIRTGKYFPPTDLGRRNNAVRRNNALRDMAHAALRLGRYAEAESACREALKNEPANRPRLKTHTMLALSLCRQGRAAEVRETFEAVFAKATPPPEELATNFTQRLNLLHALYVRALVQPDDAAGAARRREYLDQAAALLAAESDEVRQLSYFRELQTWLDEARAQLNQ